MAKKSKVGEWLEKDGLIRIEGWARDGLIDKQIAHNMGIAHRTFIVWKEKYPSINAALKKGKAPVDIAVENAMYKSAIGYKVTVKEPMKLKRIRYEEKRRIEEEYIEQVEKEIYITPNVTAQIYWLKNRRPDKWRDRREVDVTNNDGVLAQLIDGLKEPEKEEGDNNADTVKG